MMQLMMMIMMRMMQPSKGKSEQSWKRKRWKERVNQAEKRASSRLALCVDEYTRMRMKYMGKFYMVN